MRRVSLAIGVCAAAAGSVAALDIQPEALFLRGEAGQAVSADVAVINDSTVPVRVALETRGFLERPAPWLTLKPASMRLAPGARRVARLTAKVPEALGELEGEIWARQRLNGVLSETRTVRRVTLRVAGTENFEAQLKNVTAAAEGGNIVVRAVLENAGNVTLRVKLVADLERSDGPLVRATSDLTGQPLPPGSIVPVRLEAPAAGWRWAGRVALSAYYRDGEGKTVQVLSKFGEAPRAP